MSNKMAFIERCRKNGISENKALSAWEKIKNIEEYIENNWDFFQDMREFSRQKKLGLRQIAAEHGNEYTPDELDNLIEVIGLIQDNMDVDKGF